MSGMTIQELVREQIAVLEQATPEQREQAKHALLKHFGWPVVYVLLGSDDCAARQVLDVYATKEAALQAIADERYENKPNLRLISRQGKPTYEVIEKVIR